MLTGGCGVGVRVKVLVGVREKVGVAVLVGVGVGVAKIAASVEQPDIENISTATTRIEKNPRSVSFFLPEKY